MKNVHETDTYRRRGAMQRRIAGLGLALLAFGSVGCGDRGLRFTSTLPTPDRTAKDASTVSVFFRPSEPRCPFDVTGMYEYAAYSVFSTDNGSIEKLRTDAAARGFDGLFDVYCAPPGTINADIHKCTAKAFICRAGAQ